jgi:NADPH:quinone reductase-like Zn-dependent oxidoreductase
MWGLFKPKYTIPGADIAGIIEAKGENVTGFEVGDAVFGDLCASGWGGYAEYVCVPEKALAKKPKEMTFTEAASIPQAGVLALQGFRDKKQITPGMKVLINGAGGGVGTFAIQIAKSLGAEITAVDSGEKFDHMRSAGAHHVVDYTKEDFTKRSETYDLILDIYGNHSVFDNLGVLNPGGEYVLVGGTTKCIFQTLTFSPFINKAEKISKKARKTGILAHEPNKDLESLKSLYKEGKILPVIDKCFPFDKTPEALRYLGEGHAKGKVVITI